MGRDDSRVVPGLQGGTAPARAFAAYMRYAVAKRPVEQFDTELKLPDWQLEPDDELLQGDPEDYYFIDEQGNLVERGRPAGDGPGDPAEAGLRRDQPAFPIDGERPADEIDQAVGDDFLDEATGGNRPPPRPTPRSTAATPPR
jgi:penicillin-binding protein 1A